jgi:hypothetical protein
MTRIGRTIMAWLDEATGRARRRRLEEELARADAEIYRLRALLAEETRQPMQYARMREREVAIRRLTRLRIAREGHPETQSERLVAAGHASRRSVPDVS